MCCKPQQVPHGSCRPTAAMPHERLPLTEHAQVHRHLLHVPLHRPDATGSQHPILATAALRHARQAQPQLAQAQPRATHSSSQLLPAAALPPLRQAHVQLPQLQPHAVQMRACSTAAGALLQRHSGAVRCMPERASPGSYLPPAAMPCSQRVLAQLRTVAPGASQPRRVHDLTQQQAVVVARVGRLCVQVAWSPPAQKALQLQPPATLPQRTPHAHARLSARAPSADVQ